MSPGLINVVLGSRLGDSGLFLSKCLSCLVFYLNTSYRVSSHCFCYLKMSHTVERDMFSIRYSDHSWTDLSSVSLSEPHFSHQKSGYDNNSWYMVSS